MDLRAESKKQLADHPEWSIGDVTTVNLTMLSVSVYINIIIIKSSVKIVSIAPRRDIILF